MLRTLRQPRWIGLTLVVLLACLAFAQLGQWQLHRAQAKWAANDAVTGRADAAPVPVTEVLSADSGPAKTDEWRQVEMTGTYDPAATVLLRNTVLEGENGFHVLVPLRLESGPAVLVDRGFVPAGATARTAPTVPAPPGGQVTVLARVRAPKEGDLQVSRALALPTVTRVVPAAIAAELGTGPLYAAYVERRSETPAAATTPADLPLPNADVGLNLAYFVQWYAFILVALAGWFVLLRRDARDEAEQAERSLATASGPGAGG